MYTYILLHIVVSVIGIRIQYNSHLISIGKSTSPNTERTTTLFKPITPLTNIFVENVNTINGSFVAVSSIWYSQIRSKDGHTPERCVMANTVV